MAQRKPSSDEELMMITGVGEKKLQRYGTDFLYTIASF